MSSRSVSRLLLPILGTALAAAAIGAFLWLLGPRERPGTPAPAPEPPGDAVEPGADPDPELAAPLPLPPTPSDPGSPDAPPGRPLRTLRGRVVEERERPVPDVVVRVASADGALEAGARSAETGEFAVDWLGPDDATIQALPIRGYVSPPPRRLKAAELAGQEEIVLRLARGTSAVVTGAVVDARTGEGVPEVELKLAMPSAALRETLVTDATGSFASEAAFPSGELAAEVFDTPPGERVSLGAFQRRHLEGGGLGGAWELPVRIGPTYRVASTSGAVIDESFSAEVVQRHPEDRFAVVLDVLTPRGVALDVEATPAPSREQILQLVGSTALPVTFGERANEVLGRTRVRPGTPAWVRFPRPLPSEDPEREPVLVLRGGEGWVGEAPVDALIGIHPWTLGVPLVAVGSLSGTLQDRDDVPIGDALVQLFPRTADDPPEHEALTDPQGGFRLEDVPVGRYRLEIHPEIHQGLARKVLIDQGPNLVERLFVPRAEIAGPIAGELLGPAGLPDQPPLVTLVSSNGSRFRRIALATRAASPAGTWHYVFRFDDVPQGSYELAVGRLIEAGEDRRTRRTGLWWPGVRRIVPPNERARFFCAVPGELNRIRFVARSAGGGHAGMAGIAFGPEGWLRGEFSLRGQNTFPVPRGALLSWTVAAPGFQPVRGDESEVRFKGREGLVEVDLVPGWGATLHLRGFPFEEPERHLGEPELSPWTYGASYPLRRARVYADGRLVGRSDADGRVDLALPVRPAKLAIEFDGMLGIVAQTLPGNHVDESVVLFVPR